MNQHYPHSLPPLQPEAYVPLPLGSVRPRGWLLNQCRIQADGLTGHLDEFWGDLGPDNMWLGGPGEGWERAPYYLDGLVPLAYILDDAGLKAKAQRWIDSILTQQTESGWIGPVQAPGHQPYDPWPVTVLLKVLAQFYEATPDARILPAMLGFCRYLRDHLAERPLFDWSRYRWADLALSIEWLYNRTSEEWLVGVAQEVARQGFDWRGHFDRFEYSGKTARDACGMETHVVNSAMAIKSGAVRWMLSGDPDDRESVFRAIETLDAHHGQATGIFTGDEHYAGKDPNQGTELCAVVEYMYSLEVLLSLLGDAGFGDRLEQIAYNALPAACTPDMWAHQYDQQANQVLCTVAPRAWTNNGDDSNTFGLEPNFGCCTANLHQGWPKLVSHLWMATHDNGLAALAFGPSQVTARVGRGGTATINQETDYPFRGEVNFVICSERPEQFPLTLRIPSWAEGATVRLNFQEPMEVEPGYCFTLARLWRPSDQLTLSLPMRPRLERRFHNALTVHRGPLVFALKIGEEFRKLRGESPRTDWEVRPTTFWNYGLVLGNLPPAGLFEEHVSPISPTPFQPSYAPVTLTARGRRVPQWKMVNNSAGPLPESPVKSSEPDEAIELIPYGCTHLRITEFPEVETET